MVVVATYGGAGVAGRGVGCGVAARERKNSELPCEAIIAPAMQSRSQTAIVFTKSIRDAVIADVADAVADAVTDAVTDAVAAVVGVVPAFGVATGVGIGTGCGALLNMP